MIRRLVESLIVEAFGTQGAGQRIKDTDGNCLELNALIGKATAYNTLRLTRGTKQVLPSLKFFGFPGRRD